MNKSSIAVANIYLATYDSDEWGDDELDAGVLPSGKSLPMKFSRADGPNCVWDILVRDQRGKESSLYKVDLCSTQAVTYQD